MIADVWAEGYEMAQLASQQHRRLIANKCKVFACHRGAQSGDERPTFFYIFTAGMNR